MKPHILGRKASPEPESLPPTLKVQPQILPRNGVPLLELPPFFDGSWVPDLLAGSRIGPMTVHYYLERISLPFLVQDYVITLICWSILHGGNFYKDPLSTGAILCCFLDYISLKSFLFIALLQLTSFRQARYTYLYDFLLEPLYLFDIFWDTSEKVRSYISEKKMNWRQMLLDRIVADTLTFSSSWVDQQLWRYGNMTLISSNDAFDGRGWVEDWRLLKQPGYARSKQAVQDLLQQLAEFEEEKEAKALDVKNESRQRAEGLDIPINQTRRNTIN
jgi:hypothetical protein